MKLNELDKQKNLKEKRLKEAKDRKAMENFDYKDLINNDIPRVMASKQQKTTKKPF